jgi:hypothetical protein
VIHFDLVTIRLVRTGEAIVEINSSGNSTG